MKADYGAAIDAKLEAAVYARRSSHSIDRDFMAQWIKDAEPFYWTDDIARAVLQSSLSLPDDTTLALSRHTGGAPYWFWFETPLQVDLGRPVKAMLMAPVNDATRKAVIVADFYADGHRLDWSGARLLEEGLALNDTPKSGGTEGMATAKFFLACLLWIEQSIVKPESAPLPRHARKRLLRERPDAEPAIKVIMLRRMASGLPKDGDSEPREWSCRWIVRGHWRQQYYASTGERRPLFILPYIKGPEDAPLKAASASVFAVTR